MITKEYIRIENELSFERMRSVSHKYLNYIIIFIIFSGGLVWRGYSQIDLKLSYLIMALGSFALIYNSKGLVYNRKALFVFFMILVPSIWNIYDGNNSWFLLLKQVMGIGISSLIFYLLIKVNKYDIRKLFKIYLNLAFLVGLIGLFQEFFFLVGFKPGYDLDYIFPSYRVAMSATGFLRVSSIMSEPASFCYVMMPAFFVAIVSITDIGRKLMTRPRRIVIICSFLLSFSLVGYVGAVFSIFLLLYNLRRTHYLIIFGILIATFAVVSHQTIEDIRLRVDDSIDVLTGSKSLVETNLSTFTFGTNAHISYLSFKENPMFGAGLGSREICFYRHIDDVIETNEGHPVLLNIQDANSLFLRLVSDVGLFGLALVFYFIYKFHVSKKRSSDLWCWVINNSILALLAIRMLRSGHYFNNALLFFVWLYYFSGKDCRKSRNTFSFVAEKKSI
jgi:hypothetical protein